MPKRKGNASSNRGLKSSKNPLFVSSFFFYLVFIIIILIDILDYAKTSESTNVILDSELYYFKAIAHIRGQYKG